MKDVRLIPAGLALALCACNPTATKPAAPAVDVARETEAVKAAEAEIAAAYQSKNAGAIAAHYAEDATIMTAGEPPISGAGALMKSLTEQFMNPGFTLALHADYVEVAASGDLAYSRGTFKQSETSLKTNRIETHGGMYLAVLRKEDDGSWKVSAVMMTPSGAPTTGA